MNFDFCLVLLVALNLSNAQLPFQVKPRQRGFPGKNDGFKIKGTVEPLYRLNNTFIPSHYDVEVRVILQAGDSAGEQNTAPGKVRIVGVMQERTARIVLHANELTINTKSVQVIRAATGESLTVAGFDEDDVRNFFIIELASELSAGTEYEIFMEYVAKIGEVDLGLFRRTYETETGETRVMATTQFESVEARRMFPCFDEPDLKATFELTVIRSSNYTALANTELVSSTPDLEFPGWFADKFAKTVKMSTYLIAIAVSDFSYAESFFGDKSARTYAPKHLIEAGGGKYTAEVAAKTLSFYESYYNETYKLSKMDSIAVTDFGGAMENWGLNVYGTDYILFFPGVDSESHRNLVTLIIAHEIAHQWFGNLVTLKWWNEVYLNEGITTYSQYLGMEAASPDLMGVEYAILDAVQYSLWYDATAYTHPLSYNVTTPEEIDAMFSTISYEKGASVIRMVDGFLTRETLQKGLQAYLKKMAYAGAQQEDLFDSLQEAATADKRLPTGLTMSQIMHTWTDQSGFPVVKVGVFNATHVNLSQEIFLNKGDSGKEGMWYVPITVVTQEKPTLENNIPQIWLENDGVTKTFSHNVSQWMMINQNATGFYRVLYTDQLIRMIQQQLETDADVISPLSRSQLLDDYFVFANEGYVNIQTTLNLTRYLAQETHFTVWSTYFEYFSDIYTRFSFHPAYSVMKKYLQPKIETALSSVGVEESAAHKGALAMLRADLLDWACSLESRLCYDYAMKLLGQWQSTPSINPITSVDSRATLECAIVAAGGQAGFDFVFAKYQEAEADSEMKNELLNALACATETDVILGLLRKTLNTTSGLDPLDASATLENLAENSFGHKLVLFFIAMNIDEVIDVIGDGSPLPISRVISNLSGYFYTQAQLDEVQMFFNTHKDKLEEVAAYINNSIRIIRANIEWMDTIGFEIWMWLWFQ